jgi:hypothetical protein
VESIKRGNAIAVSDGSYKEGFGTSAFVIQSLSIGNRISGRNIPPGHSSIQSSYRSELAGIAGIVNVLCMLCQIYSVQEGALEVGLDNEQAMKSVFHNEWDPSIKKPDFDLIYDIRRKIRTLPLTLTGRWIKGHQDKEGVDYSTLDLWTLLNIEMDHRAGDFLTEHFGQPPPNHRFGHEKLSLYFQGTKLSFFDKKDLYKQVFGKYCTNTFDPASPKKEWPIQDFWKEREGLSQAAFTSIHWEAYGKAFRGIPFGKQRWLVKHSTGQCAVGHMALRRKHQDHSECPRCQQVDETVVHVIQCTDARADACWQLQLQKLHQWMTEQGTHPDLALAILTHLRDWRLQRPTTPLSVPDDVLEVMSNQDQIGWWSFLLGRVHHSFADIQTNYYQSQGSQRTGRPWLTSLIKQVWEVSFAMWEHRNSIHHSGHSPHTANQLHCLRAQAQEELDLGTMGLLPQDHHWMDYPDKVLQFDLADLRLWYTSVKLARQAFQVQQQQTQHRLRHSRAFLRNWLEGRPQPADLIPPQPTPTPDLAEPTPGTQPQDQH